MCSGGFYDLGSFELHRSQKRTGLAMNGRLRGKLGTRRQSVSSVPVRAEPSHLLFGNWRLQTGLSRCSFQETPSFAHKSASDVQLPLSPQSSRRFWVSSVCRRGFALPSGIDKPGRAGAAPDRPSSRTFTLVPGGAMQGRRKQIDENCSQPENS